MIAQVCAGECCTAKGRAGSAPSAGIGERRGPSVVGLVGAESWVSEWGLGEWGWRGRRESVPGGLAAPSMARIPRQPHPPSPRQIPVAAPPREITSKSKSGSLRSQSQGSQPTAVAVAYAFSLDLPVVDAAGTCPWPGGWVAQGRKRHGPEACLGRVGQDAQPRSCRVRRTAHTSKARPSLQGRIHGVPCAPHPPGPPPEIRCKRPTPATRGLRRWLPTPRQRRSPPNPRTMHSLTD